MVAVRVWQRQTTELLGSDTGLCAHINGAIVMDINKMRNRRLFDILRKVPSLSLGLISVNYVTFIRFSFVSNVLLLHDHSSKTLSAQIKEIVLGEVEYTRFPICGMQLAVVGQGMLEVVFSVTAPNLYLTATGWGPLLYKMVLPSSPESLVKVP